MFRYNSTPVLLDYVNARGVTDFFLNEQMQYLNLQSQKVPLLNNNQKVLTISEASEKIKTKCTASFIVFIPPEENFGTGHFVTIVQNETNIFYFDSYGLPCLVFDLSTAMKESGKQIDYNNIHLQSLNSNHCGLYALLFHLYFCCDIVIDLNFVEYNCGLNDELCINYIKAIHEWTLE